MTKGPLWAITIEYGCQREKNKRVGSFQTGLDGLDGARGAQEVSDRTLGGRDQRRWRVQEQRCARIVHFSGTECQLLTPWRGMDGQ